MVQIDMDMPKNCEECPCCQPDVHFMLFTCGIDGSDIMDYETGGILQERPAGCSRQEV